MFCNPLTHAKKIKQTLTNALRQQSITVGLGSRLALNEFNSKLDSTGTKHVPIPCSCMWANRQSIQASKIPEKHIWDSHAHYAILQKRLLKIQENAQFSGKRF